MLCKNMVVVVVECVLDVCKLNVSLVHLHCNAKRYGSCLSWSWRTQAEYLWYSKVFFFMVTRLVDRQNYPFLLPQEMPGIHSMLNQFDSKDLLVYLWLSFTSLIQMASHSNCWPRKSQHLRTWSSRSGLDFHYNPGTSYMGTLCHRGGSLEDRTETSQRGLGQCLLRLYVKIFPPALSSSLLNT